MNKIICRCYNDEHEFNTVGEAKAFFLDCMAWSDGSEQQRYAKIYLQLCSGVTYCTDTI